MPYVRKDGVSVPLETCSDPGCIHAGDRVRWYAPRGANSGWHWGTAKTGATRAHSLLPHWHVIMEETGHHVAFTEGNEFYIVKKEMLDNGE